MHVTGAGDSPCLGAVIRILWVRFSTTSRLLKYSMFAILTYYIVLDIVRVWSVSRIYLFANLVKQSLAIM